MMLPELVKQNQLARIEEKKSMLLHPAVNLNQFEMIAAKASIGTLIGHYSDQELNVRASALCLNLFKDLGIKIAEVEDLKYFKGRFIQILKDYYSNFTLEQVSKAFELLNRGELDEFLPKDKFGNPDRGHYQSFSLEFVNKVLRAFESYNRKIWFKAVKQIPEPEKVMTEEEIQEAFNGFRADIIEKFHNFKKEGILSDFLAPSLVVKELHQKGIIIEICPVSDSDRRKSLYILNISKNLSDLEKSEIRKRYDSGNIHPRHQVEAERVRDLNLIREAFEGIETLEL